MQAARNPGLSKSLHDQISITTGGVLGYLNLTIQIATDNRVCGTCTTR